MSKDGFKKLAEKIKGIKHKEIIFAVVAVLIMLAIYFSSFTSSQKTSSSDYDYCADMQSRLETAVDKLSGGSDSKVIISWQTSVEAVIAYTETVNQNSSTKTPQLVSGGPIVLKEIYPEAKGIAVVCKNGDKASVKVAIINMASTLLGLSPDKIVVYSSNK